MIDRYVILAKPTNFSDDLKLTIPKSYKATFNAAPTKLLPITTMQRPDKVELFTWGPISNFSNNKKLSPKLFNLPFIQALSKPSHRRGVEERRCVIWANGFYVWKPIAKRKTTPYYVSISDDTPIAIAGIWEAYDSFEGETVNTFMMFTSPSDAQVQSFQEDMPVIIPQNDLNTWLSNETALAQIESMAVDQKISTLRIHPVSPAIVNMDAEGSELIKPSNPTDQYGNYTLFG